MGVCDPRDDKFKSAAVSPLRPVFDPHLFHPYDMTYTFNDIIDPNFRYKQDKVCYNILEQLKKQMIR